MCSSDLFKLPKKTVLTTSSVSLDASINLDTYSNPDILIENMEAYSIIGEVIEAASSIDVIFGITNAVGPDGSKDWEKNFLEVANMTARFILENIHV